MAGSCFLGLALLLALAVSPAAALTPAELRAMRQSAAKAHRLENGRHPAVHQTAQRLDAEQMRSRMSAAPPSNLGGHVSEERGVKEWHSQDKQPAHRRHYDTQHNPYVDMQAHPNMHGTGLLHKKPRMGVTASGSGDPDTPTAEEARKWDGARTEHRQIPVQVPALKRMTGDYERQSDGRVRVRPPIHHDVLGNYEERTWSASKDTIIEHAEEDFLKHESPMAVHDCGLDGDDCNYSGTGVEDHDRGTYMKARTQSLAQESWLPDCSTVNCAAEIGMQHHAAAAARQPQVIGAGTSASVQAQLAYDHATDHHWSSARPQASAATAPVEKVEKVELSRKDIDMLAKELYKEATAKNRESAEQAAIIRESQIKRAVAAAVESAPVVARPAAMAPKDASGAPLLAVAGGRGRQERVAPASRRVRAMHAAHRSMLSPNGEAQGAGAAQQGQSGVREVVHDRSQQASWKQQAQAQAQAQAQVQAQTQAQHAPRGRRQEAAEQASRTWMPQGHPVDGYEPGAVQQGWPRVWPWSESEAPARAAAEEERAEAEGEHANDLEGEEEEQQVSPEAGAEEGVEGDATEEGKLEPAPVTWLAGACCDADGKCKKCPGPDEEYSMWDNLYIFPGDETGMGRSFMHVCLAILFIIIVVLLCTFILDKRKEETGEHPLDGIFQSAKEFGETTSNSMGDAWKNTFSKKEEEKPAEDSVAI